jgi:hypothetical protein
MKDRTRNCDGSSEEIVSAPFRIRLPGFAADEAVGLGDLVGRVSYALGVTPCAGCRERRDLLNRWIVLTR